MQYARVENQLPLAVHHLRVALANPSVPTVVTALLVTPERVNLHDRESGVTFIGDLDFKNFTPVVNQFVGLEQLLPACFPTLTMESS